MPIEMPYNAHLSPRQDLEEILELVSIGRYHIRGSYVGDRSDGWPVHHFMYTLAGGAVAELHDQTIYAKPHTWWYLPPMPGHIYRTDPEVGYWEGLWIECRGQQIEHLLEIAGIAEQRSIADVQDALPAIEALHQLVQREGDQAALEAASLLMRVIALVGRCHRDVSRDPFTIVVDKIQNWVDQHIDQTIDIEELAQIAGFSTFHFLRVFKQHMSITPGAYIVARRILRAKTLLHQGQLNVSEVGRAVGYDRVQNFSAAFKRETGMSPRRYLKSLMQA